MKKTNKEMFVMLLSVIESSNNITETDRIELTDFVNLKIEQIEKKANTISKADKAKAELNAKIAQLIVDGLIKLDKPVRISELIKGYEPLNEYSTQKLTPIITTLVNDNKVKKIASKRTILYTVEVA